MVCFESLEISRQFARVTRVLCSFFSSQCCSYGAKGSRIHLLDSRTKRSSIYRTNGWICAIRTILICFCVAIFDCLCLRWKLRHIHILSPVTHETTIHRRYGVQMVLVLGITIFCFNRIYGWYDYGSFIFCLRLLLPCRILRSFRIFD